MALDTKVGLVYNGYIVLFFPVYSISSRKQAILGFLRVSFAKYSGRMVKLVNTLVHADTISKYLPWW